MSVRPIIDAGPALNFLSINKERLLVAVLGPLSATSAAAAAAIAYHAVDASPHAPSWRGARTGMLNSHRHTRMPASAISAATTAVAAPPDHSCLASTVRPGELPRSERGSCCRDMAQAAFFSGCAGLTECRVFPVRRSSMPWASVQAP